MNKKSFLICFVAEYIALLLTAFVFMRHDDIMASMMPETKAQMAYFLGIFCALGTVGGCFLSLKQRNWHPIVRLVLLIAPALTAMFCFFFLDDRNMLYCLPLLSLVSFILLKQVYEE